MDRTDFGNVVLFAGVIRFLATESGGTLADKNGAITKRFQYPAHGARLQPAIILQVCFKHM